MKKILEYLRRAESEHREFSVRLRSGHLLSGLPGSRLTVSDEAIEYTLDGRDVVILVADISTVTVS